MENPLISIVVPMYNAEKFFGDGYMIDSVLSQTYKDYELILVNDGSTDETPRKIDNIVSGGVLLR